MTAYDLITAYQKSQKPPLIDADLARLWDVNRSIVCLIKQGKRKPSAKTFQKIRSKTPELFTALLKLYYGTPPEPHQANQNGQQGWLGKFLSVITFEKYRKKKGR